jgi:hypothetical protein
MANAIAQITESGLDQRSMLEWVPGYNVATARLFVLQHVFAVAESGFMVLPMVTC